MRPEDVPSTRSGLVGVFDSGVGGLSVMRALIGRLPSEDLMYVADTANCPYGSRSPEQVLSYSVGISRYLISCGAKLIVVACNTASAVALATLRRTFPQIPFVGIVPAVKPAAQLTRTGVVGVLGTETTLNGQLYKDVVAHYTLGIKVISQPCHGLVEQVEAGDLDSPKTLRLLRACVDPLIAAGADVLVLGCTHYPFLAPALRQVVGTRMMLVEPSEAIARQTESVLSRMNLLNTEVGQGHVVFCTTGDTVHFRAVLECLLGYSGSVRHLNWDQEHLLDFLPSVRINKEFHPRSLVS